MFPARVVTPRATYERARFMVIQGRAFVWTEQERRVQLVEAALVIAFGRERDPKATYTVQTTNGEVWSCARAHGCGCGSKLRNFNWQADVASVEVTA